MLTQTRVVTSTFTSYTNVSRSGDVGVGALTTLLLAAAIVRRHRSQVGLGLVAMVSGNVASFTSSDAIVFARQTTPVHPLIAAMFAAAGAVLMGFAALATGPPTRNLVQAAAISITAIALYSLGGSPDLELDVLGGLISASTIGVAARFAMPGMAFADAVGVAALVVDIGARNFTSAAALGSFLVLAAGFGLGLILVMRQLLAVRGGPTRWLVGQHDVNERFVVPATADRG